jgi:hypothetical protein
MRVVEEVEEVVAHLAGVVVQVTSRPLPTLVAALARAEAALLAETLLLDGRGFRLQTDQSRISGAVRLAERVASGDQRAGLLVVHRHARKRLADVCTALSGL